MVDTQVSDHMRLLVVLHRAVGTLESRRLPALVPQVRQHRLLPLVEVVAAGTLVHPVPPDDHELAPRAAQEPLHSGHLLRAL